MYDVFDAKLKFAIKNENSGVKEVGPKLVRFFKSNFDNKEDRFVFPIVTPYKYKG